MKRVVINKHDGGDLIVTTDLSFLSDDSKSVMEHEKKYVRSCLDDVRHVVESFYEGKDNNYDR